MVELSWNKDLSKRDLIGNNSLYKFTGVPHLQIGLVRDVVYKLVKFLEGNYRITNNDENTIFEFTIPVEPSFGKSFENNSFNQENDKSAPPNRFTNKDGKNYFWFILLFVFRFNKVYQ